MVEHEKYMQAAFDEAQKAFANDEVPIGAVVVRNGEIIGRGFNKIELLQDPTAHAEIIAIREAATTIGTWILDECDLYVSVEPCIMCLGAVFQSRIKSIIYGTGNSRFGAITDKNYIELAKTAYMREPQIISIGGEYEEKCRDLLQTFFRQIRIKNKSEKNEIVKFAEE
ncbi:MAG: nucleoside deaminase [Chitinivibrionia bacterium]|nr:nucleoside deaminase [Chitinivibrionia bacterium]